MATPSNPPIHLPGRLRVATVGVVIAGLIGVGCSKQTDGGLRQAAVGPVAVQQPATNVATAPAPSRAEDEFSAPLGPDYEPVRPVPHYSSYVLTMPEIPGVVSWKKLAQVQIEPGAQPPQRFDPDVARLDGQQVKLQGFMLPLEVGEKHKRFILMALPPSCSFCLPGGPESVVEVIAREPVKYTVEPIVVAGKFSVLKSDPLGLFYRLNEAKPSSPG